MVNTDLLCSTENSSQHPVLTYVGKEPEKEWMWAHVEVNRSVVQHK